jgi:hypothetical protein
MLAIVRPDDWNLPLFLHVLGAMTLVGSLAAVVTGLLVGVRRDGDVAALLARFGFRTLLVAVLPSFIVMRIGAEWIRSKEFTDVREVPAWVDLGYVLTDVGGLLLLVALVLSWVGLVRGRRAGSPPRTLAGIVAVLATILLAAYVVAVWAMTTKPR